MIINSIFFKIAMWMIHLFMDIYNDSFIKKIFDSITSIAKEIFEDSILFKLLLVKEKDDLSRPYFFTKISKIYMKIISFFNKLYISALESSMVLKLMYSKILRNILSNSKFIAMFDNISIEGFIIGIYVLTIPLLADSIVLIASFLILPVFILISIIKNNTQFNYSTTIVPLTFFFLLIILNTIFSINPSGSFRDLALHLGGACVVFTIVNGNFNKETLKFVGQMIVFAGILMSLYAVYQYITEVPMGSGWVDVTSDVTTRVFATFENPNLFSEYIILIFPINCAMCFLPKNNFYKLFNLGALLALGTSMLLTYSRAGWLGLIFAFGVFIVLVNFKFIIPFIFAAIGSLFILPSSIISRLISIVDFSDSSGSYRVELWGYTLNIVKDFWLGGIGLGYLTFRELTPYYMKNMAPFHSHNTFLQVTVEMGVIGLFVFLWLILNLLKHGFTTVRTTSNRNIKYFIAATIGGLCGLLVQGMAEHVLYNPKIILMFWVIVGLIVKLSINGEERYEIK